MTGRVYVAASSQEFDRARWAMEKVRAAGYEVTFDWVALIEQVGAANPADATASDWARWAGADAVGVAEADVFWMLSPQVGAARGAFFELGYAYAMGKPCFVSWPTHACSIFTALASEIGTDERALAVVCQRLEEFAELRCDP